MYRPTPKTGRPAGEPTTTCCQGSGGRGFSLIELLIAMAVGLIVLLSAVRISDQLFYLTAAISERAQINENLRAATNLMARDLTGAGSGVPIGGIPLRAGSGLPAIPRPGWGTQTFPAPTGTLTILTTGPGLGPLVSGRPTDEITILAMDGGSLLGQTPLTAISADGTQITVDAGTNISSGPSQVKVNDLIMLSNSNGAALGMVTAVDSANHLVRFATGDPWGINQSTATSGTISQLASPGTPPVYPPTSAFKLALVTYYLDNTDAANPKLMRQYGALPPVEVVDGVTSLQFTYDYDSPT
ncbi:MAG: PulJ/GspJ family protein, partial [Terriglobales bacterium]